MSSLENLKLGKSKLGWFKSNKNPNPKSPYFNNKMEKKLKTNFEWALCGD
jgi:hypothetical protein